MATCANIAQATGAERLSLVALSKCIIQNFVWAGEVKRRCEHSVAAGKPLDHDNIKRIAAEVDASKLGW